MYNMFNFVNNHLASVYSHPVNAARLQAKGFTPPSSSPPVRATDLEEKPLPFLHSLSQHFFTSNPQQNIDPTRGQNQ